MKNLGDRTEVAYYGYKRPQEKFQLLQQFYSQISDIGIVGVDTETISVEDKTLLGAGFSFGDGENYWFGIDSEYFPRFLLAEDKVKKIYHNSYFDLQAYKENGTIPWIGNNSDSCVLAMLVGLPPKLSTLCLELFGRPERLIDEILEKDQTMLDLPKEVVAERGCRDAEDALDAWVKINEDWDVPEKALRLEEEFLPVAMEVEARGMRLDLDAVERHHKAISFRKDILSATARREWGFNPGSSYQLADFIKVVMGENTPMVPMKRGKDGKKRPSLGKDVVNGLMDTMRAAGWLKYRAMQDIYKALELRLEYMSLQALGGLFKRLTAGDYLVGDRIHPRMNMGIAATGRITRSKPATQNINYQYRDIVIPEDGEELVVWDWSQIELREAAWQWNDKVMQETFLSGGDAHSNTTNRLVDMGYGPMLDRMDKVAGAETVEERRRYAGKTVNFLVTYLGTAATMAQKTGIPEAVCQQIMDGYFEIHSGLREGIEETKRFLHRHGYTQTALGRRRVFDDYLASGRPDKIARAEREGVNHTIQGTCAEYMKQALIDCHRAGYPIIHTVHDEAEWSAAPGHGFVELPRQVTPYPAPIDVQVGPNWRDITNVR